MPRSYTSRSAWLVSLGLAAVSAQAATRQFVFGPKEAPEGSVIVASGMRYDPKVGYGFEPGAVTKVVTGGREGRSACTSDHPFLFSVALPEGDYRVEIEVGSPVAAADTTIKAEQRRLYFDSVKTAADEVRACRLVVDVRTPDIAGGGRIALKAREIPFANWDDKLTLEFDGPSPSVESIRITPIAHETTIYLAGDSTVTDQDHEPWASWGQMLPRFLDTGVVVANYAESGETAASFIGEHRWQKVLSVIKPGDYVFIQFGHNDQKDHRPGAGAFTTYTDTLERLVGDARKAGARPVLITSMNRRTFAADGTIQNSLGDYPEAVRRLAARDAVPLIDLNRMSKAFYEALGPETAKGAFVHFAANTYPGQDKELKDDTHFRNYGAYELARCIVEAMRTATPQLAQHLSPDVAPFDPSRPDPIDRFILAASPASQGFQVPAQAK